MKPEDAVAYVQQKGFQISWNWYEVRDAAHAQAFTVAKVARMDVLQDIRDAVEASLEKGWSLGQFKKNLTPVLQARGWWGKQVIVDSQGGAEMAQLGSPRRLETIYRTNIQSAMMAARYKQMLANVRFRPYWQYIAVMDGRTRPSHAALHGRVYRYDDPIWQYLFPPNGYNCRCRVVALSERDMRAKGLVLSSSDGQLVTREIDAGIDPRTGEVYRTEQTGIRLVHDGKPIVFYPDAGFNYNHGAAGLEHAAQVLARKVEYADPELGARATSSALHLVLPQLSAEFRTWAAQAIEASQAANNYRVVGALKPDALAALRRLGVQPETAALTIRDAELLHLAARHTGSARRGADHGGHPSAARAPSGTGCHPVGPGRLRPGLRSPSRPAAKPDRGAGECRSAGARRRRAPGPGAQRGSDGEPGAGGRPGQRAALPALGRNSAVGGFGDEPNNRPASQRHGA
ncbi:minor head protein and DNA pilot [Ralstonia phage RS138]|uniref:minor head protein and DNA pilot n=1 Tax=Ralstonia phage RS138 TaxID=1483485 RepID=UPI0006BD96D6|nr:minor head protein and DNA pilot [Ralstonia phage RS138]BAS32832.1 virion morphogenesis protein [Ralstonia phage RS138]